MADLDRDRWRQLDPLLDHALELPADARATWLDELRRSAPDLARELEALLAGEAVADRRGFLTTPIVGKLPTSFTPPTGPRAGARFGAYVIERPLGQGGMGSVWLARRADGRFEGFVAIKLLNLALLGDTGRERFRREGSTLARLTHAGVARLLDAGVADGGQPYLVLEHVEGMEIDAYATERKLDLAARVRLVLQVLAAVDHAHAQLVVHRDIKPSNILVTADGTTKLLDFGIAKLLDDEARAALTSEGLVALTPEFAAPEQLRGEPITTATDVYALGVLLYLLVAGHRPYVVKGKSLVEIERIVREVDVPRLGTRGMLGDLDAIARKAMHRDPARRYQSAAAFADDLRRALEGHPVLARPDGFGYRLRKFVGRHRIGVAVASGVAALLVVAGVRERELRARAEAEARKAQAVQEYLVSVFDVADPFAPPDEHPEDVTARALLDRGARRVDSTLAGEPETRAELRLALGRVYGNLGLFADAAPLLRRALDERRTLYGPRHPTVAEAMDRLGEVLVRQGRYDEAEPLLRDALAQRRADARGPSDALAESLDHLATLLQERGKLADAEPLFREAIGVRQAVHGADHEAVADALNNYALVLVLRERYDEADPLYRRALAINRARFGEDHPRYAETLHNLAQLEQNRGRYAEAATLYRRALDAKRRALGDLHPSVTVNLNNLAVLLAVELGRVDEGEALVREALALDRRMFGARHPYVAESLRNLATMLRLRGEFAESERFSHEAIAMNRSLFGAEHHRIAVATYQLGQSRLAQGDVAGALALYRQALAMFEKVDGLKAVNTTAVTIAVARAERELGDARGADRRLRDVLTRLDTSSRALRAQTVSLEIGLGQALIDEHRPEDARPLLERAVATSRERFGERHWRTAEARLALGQCWLALGARGRAEPLLREAAASLDAYRRAQPALARRAQAAAARITS